MGCNTSRRPSQPTSIECELQKVKFKDVQDIFEQIAEELQAAERCRTGIHKFKANGFQLPDVEDKEKGRKYLQALQSVCDRIENAYTFIEDSVDQVKQVLRAKQKQIKENDPDDVRIIRSNLMHIQDQMDKMSLVHKLSLEVREISHNKLSQMREQMTSDDDNSMIRVLPSEISRYNTRKSNSFNHLNSFKSMKSDTIRM